MYLPVRAEISNLDYGMDLKVYIVLNINGWALKI